MKLEQEPLCEGLYKREEEDGDSGSFIYDFIDFSVPKERDHLVRLDRNDSIEEITNRLREARRSSNDIFIGFYGGRVEYKMISNEECCVAFREMVESVKAIKIIFRSTGGGLADGLDMINQSMAMTSVGVIVELASRSLVELSLIGHVLTDESALNVIRSLKQVDGLEYLSLRGMDCSADTFSKLMDGLIGSLPNIRYFDIAGNKVSRDGGEKIKDVIIGHEKLVYLDIGMVLMDHDGFDLILDGCEISRRMQVIIVENTIACTNGGMRKLEERMMSGKLCLLSIRFYGNVSQQWISRLYPYLARNALERESIGHIRNHELRQIEKPQIIETIAAGFDGIENVYKCLVGNYNDILLEVINGSRIDE
jgi:hypothetical protein